MKGQNEASWQTSTQTPKTGLFLSVSLVACSRFQTASSILDASPLDSTGLEEICVPTVNQCFFVLSKCRFFPFDPD